jgi:hypothetical protein
MLPKQPWSIIAAAVRAVGMLAGTGLSDQEQASKPGGSVTMARAP